MRYMKMPSITQDMVDAARTVLGDVEETLPVKEAIRAALGACKAFNVRPTGSGEALVQQHSDE